MKIIRSPFFLRGSSRVGTHLVLANERTFRREFISYISPIYISFAVVDLVASGGVSIWYWILARIGVCTVGIGSFWLLRSRVSNWFRFLAALFPYFIYIHVFMYAFDLWGTPYFAGSLISVFTISWLFSFRPVDLICIYLTLFIPELYELIRSDHSISFKILGVSMILGSLLLSAVNSLILRNERIKKFHAERGLAEVLDMREQEVRDQAKKILVMEKFKSQFSPQIVNQIFQSKDRFEHLQKMNICVLIFDIQDSTLKSRQLKPEHYAEALERVVELMTSISLKWNLVIDRFTGDGVQVFSGCPESRPDDLDRAISAASEVSLAIKEVSPTLEPLWGGPIQIRSAIVEDEELVGFIGKGAFRSFSAIGTGVSLAHRLVARTAPGEIIACSRSDAKKLENFAVQNFQREKIRFDDLKGFDGEAIVGYRLMPRPERGKVSVTERCKVCQTTLVMQDGPRGLPTLVCPACSLNDQSDAGGNSGRSQAG